jgi:hypothetical protein
MTKAATAVAEAVYWDADDEFERYERRQRFIAHFAAVLTHRHADVLGAIGERCWDHGYCALSIDTLADDALVSRMTMYNALRAAHKLGLIEMQENVIRIVSPKWQALLREEVLENRR